MTLYYQFERGQQGDKRAVQDIYLQFHSNIKKLSKNLKYEEGETDLTIALLELIKNINLSKLPKDDDGLSKFIYRTLKNKFTDLYRKNVVSRQQNFVYINYDILCDEKVNFDSTVFMSSLLSLLPSLQRTVIIKKFIYQYSDKEISKTLRISRQAVNKLKNRGLKNLRKIFKKWGYEEVGRKSH